MGGVGRTMITAGVLILLFVAYQLWGTGLRTAQAQNRLEDEFAAAQDAAADVIGPSTSTTPAPATDPSGATVTTLRLPATTAPSLPEELLPSEGESAGQIEIPSIGVDWTFVEGVGVNDLKDGPGHYPETPFPGQAGNAAMAGHRTTYGAPFANVDRLELGDEILVTTLQGRFHYVVRSIQIVSPRAVEVLTADYWTLQPDLEPFTNALTLTACHPKYSARQRIIIGAELVGEPLPGFERPAPTRAPDLSGLSGGTVSRTPAVLLGCACAAIWLLAWAIGRRWRRLRWASYALFIWPFLVALYFFFENFSRLLPANY